MGTAKRCLLVEDDPDDQEFFISTLNIVSATTECYTAKHGKEALSILMNEDLQPDYIFTDLNMPLMNGFELIQELKRIPKLSQIPVIMFSSDYSGEQIQRAKAIGATAFYSKLRFVVLSEILQKYF